MLSLSMLRAQQHCIYSSQIHTLRVVKNDDVALFPILSLQGKDKVEISFDDLTHVYNRYTYRIIHCDADWNATESLFASDYLEGFSEDLTIDNYAQSLNTTVQYTHYSFTLPNENVRFRLSGNYRIDIYGEDDEEHPVASACLRVVDTQFGIIAKVLTNTDIDWNERHQQIEWSLHFGQNKVQNPEKEIRTYIMQNRRTDTQVSNVPATFVTNSGMEWKNNKSLIFKGGNEYRKFEILNLHLATLGVDRMRWYEPYYHAQLIMGAPQRNYIYQEDQDGRWLVRTEDNVDNDILSDYVIVHYSLRIPQREDGDFYVNGDWTYNRYLPNNKMTYDVEQRAYVADILQKQGYYNYQYLFVEDRNKNLGLTAPAEGDYYQTENEYTILVYYHPQGSRYDQLVAYRDFVFLPGH